MNGTEILMRGCTPDQLAEFIQQRVEGSLLDKLSKAIPQCATSSPAGEGEVMFDVPGVSKFTHFKPCYIYELVEKGLIPYSKPGKKLLFFKSEILDWLKSHRGKTVAELSEDANNYTIKMK